MPYENFEKGVDPGLQAWLRMRLAARIAREKGGRETVVIKDVPYKYYEPWVKGFFHLSSDDIQEILNSSDQQLWNRSMVLLSSFPLTETPIPMTVKAIFNIDFSHITPEDMEKIVNRVMQERTIIFLESLLNHPQFSLNTRIGRSRQTLLHVACRYGDIEKVSLLLERKCKVNVADTEGQTPVHYCMHPAEELMHSEKILLMLLKNKATVDVCDIHQRSALHYACIIQSSPLVLTLLQKGADLAILDHDNKFPLDYLRAVSALVDDLYLFFCNSICLL